jgi:hypothetical protein
MMSAAARPKCSPARRSGATRRSRHRRRARTPAASQAEHRGADRGERMAVVRRSNARLVPQPGQSTSSHSRPAISAARIVGDHGISRPAASCSFRRSITAFASARGSIGDLSPSIDANVEPARPDPHGAAVQIQVAEHRRRQASVAAKARWTKARRRIREAAAIPVCPVD